MKGEHATHIRKARSEATLERIIAAAMEEFAEAGFGGARVDAIARRAGVNKATLYYHVGDKKTLYARIIEHVLSGAALRLERLLEGATSPRDKVRAYVRALGRTFSENPQMPRIIMREMVSGAHNLPDTFFDGIVRIVGMLADIIEEGRREGVFAQARPALVHFMTAGALVMSAAAFPIIQARVAARTTGDLFGDKRDEEGLVSEVEGLILRLLEAPCSKGRNA